MIDLDPATIGLEFGGGATVGFIAGYVAKKVTKLVAVIVGAQLAALRYLESEGILDVDWTALGAELSSLGAYADPGYVEGAVSTLSIGAGVTGGFLLGFRRG